MKAPYVIGLDLGSSGGRCLLINTETGAAAASTRPWSHERVPAYWPWALDLDLDHIWKMVGEMAREAIHHADIAPDQIAALGIASMRHGTVAIDAAGTPLFAAPTMDGRAGVVALQLTAQGAEIYARTGRWPNPILTAVRLLWLREHRPDLFERVDTVLSLSAWLAHRLTGARIAERTQAAETMVMDLTTRAWADDLIASLDLPRHILPPLVEAGIPIGGLSDAAAMHLGLTPGMPVVAAGADTQCALLGTNVVASGQTGVVAGSTASVMHLVDAPYFDPQHRLWTGPHLMPGAYVVESNAGPMGRTLDWLARSWYPESPNPVAALCTEAATVPPGAGGILSTAGARAFDATSLGLPVDTLHFAATGPTADGAGRAAMARAILEGMAYAVRANVEQLGPGTDASRALHLTGGMARSALWTRLLGDVLDRPIRVGATTESAARGATICAAVGGELYPDLPTAAEQMANTVRRYRPDTEIAEGYRSRYRAWRALGARRAEADDDAAEVIVAEMMATQPPEDSGAGTSPPFRPNIYVSAELDEAGLDRLRELGEVTFAGYRRESRLLVGEDLWEALAGVHVFVTEVDVVDAEALQRLPDLRAVIVCRGTPVNVDIAACTAAGVPVIHTPGRNAEAVADLTLALMLMQLRRLTEATAFLRQPGGEAGDIGRMGMAHERFQGHELWRRSVGLIGAGAVGRAVIRRLRPFGARVLVTDPFLDAEEAALLGVERVTLDDLLARSDIVSLHAPVTESTRGMVDAGALARMKDGAFLVNTARAALIDDVALAEALKSGKLGGAALDVFASEPPGADDPLLALPNVIATPHIAGNTYEVGAHQGSVVVDALERLLAGREPDHLLNPETLLSFRWRGERAGSAEELAALAQGPAPAVTDLQRDVQQAPPETEPTSGGLFSRLTGRLRGRPPEDAPGAPADDDTLSTLHRILTRFTAAVATDPRMTAFATGKDVTMRFTLRDAGQDFYLNFVGGEVDAGMGDPPRAANVHLKMNAAILDGIFTGKVNGMRAAMTGKLSFSGDTNKAMAFQRLQGDLSRLYQAARDAVGDPGDLSRIVTAHQPVTAPAATDLSLTPSKEPDMRDEIVKVVHDLYTKGHITPTGGNVSTRTDENPHEIWITPSAIFKGDLRPEMLVRIDLDGNVLSDNGYSASIERHMHCAIYRQRPDVDAVVHAHGPHAILMAMTGTPFLPISSEAAMLGDLPVVPFIGPGTPELGETVADALGQQGIAVLMQNHGLVVVGPSVRRAADWADVVETTAYKLITCRLMGVEPATVPDDIVAEMRELGKMVG